MKRVLAALFVISVSTMIVTCSAFGGSYGSNGTFIGAGSGALIGQAIGRDTEGTLLGTAIGGVLGYMIGNEMDKNRMNSSYSSSGRRKVYSNSYNYRPDYRDRQSHVVTKRYSKHARIDDCRETEILATVEGHPEIVSATACYENGRWTLQEQRPEKISKTIIINKHIYPGTSHVIINKRHGRRHWKAKHKRRHHRRFVRHSRRHYDW